MKENLAAFTVSTLKTIMADVDALIRYESEAYISKMKAAAQIRKR